jgi:plastocyanin
VIKAEGNALYDTQDLRFDPASATVKVGDMVRWTNVDQVVPHTATEDHGLWDLGGTYGQTPANPPGFGPGESRDRLFEAGTQHYYCRVHPQQMHGVIAVPVSVALVDSGTGATRAVATAQHPGSGRRRHARQRIRHRGHRTHPHRGRAPTGSQSPAPTARLVRATWASAPAQTGLAFDVERRQGNGPWERVLTGTAQPSMDFAADAPGTVWSVRARLRSATDPTRATDWSPASVITA